MKMWLVIAEVLSIMLLVTAVMTGISSSEFHTRVALPAAAISIITHAIIVVLYLKQKHITKL
jgi:hypothetical protein